MRKIIFCSLFLSAQLVINAQSPSIGAYNVYYGTLHNHTTVSDGTGTEDDAYNYAKNVAGLDYFSTSNHLGSIVEVEWATIKAAADKYNEDSIYTTFWGFEWSGAGDVTVINTDDYPGISEDPSGTFVELCAWIEARNCVAFFNHPGRGGSVHFEGFTTTPTDKIVGIELFNKTAPFDVYYYNDGFYADDGGLNHFSEANSRGWKSGPPELMTIMEARGVHGRITEWRSWQKISPGRIFTAPCRPEGSFQLWIKTLHFLLNWIPTRWVQP